MPTPLEQKIEKVDKLIKKQPYNVQLRSAWMELKSAIEWDEVKKEIAVNKAAYSYLSRLDDDLK